MPVLVSHRFGDCRGRRVSRHTAELEAVGQFRWMDGNSLYNVSMNRTVVTLNELLAQLKTMLPMLREKYNVRTLEVFGSYVRGEERENSDLDLLVTFDEVPSLFQYVALENYLSDELKVKVDLVMKDSLKPAIAKRILEEARAI